MGTGASFTGRRNPESLNKDIVGSDSPTQFKFNDNIMLIGTCEVESLRPIDILYPIDPDRPSADLVAPTSTTNMPCDIIYISLKSLKGTGKRNITIKWTLVGSTNPNDETPVTLDPSLA